MFKRILALILTIVTIAGSLPLDAMAVQRNTSKTKDLAVAEKVKPVTLPTANSKKMPIARSKTQNQKKNIQLPLTIL